MSPGKMDEMIKAIASNCIGNFSIHLRKPIIYLECQHVLARKLFSHSAYAFLEPTSEGRLQYENRAILRILYKSTLLTKTFHP